MMDTKTKAAIAPAPESRFLILREGEAARRLALGARTLQQLRLTGNGPPFVKIGNRRIGYFLSDLEAWAMSRRCTATGGEVAP